jgi:hypothetical protein
MQYDLLAGIDASCFYPFQACIPIHVWCQAYLPTAVLITIYELHYRFHACFPLSLIFPVVLWLVT